ncbi:hypothetical protein EJB05_45134, partial [Eragrostis curvula]
MGKSPKSACQSSCSASKTAFTKALQAVRTKRGYAHLTAKVSGTSASRRSAIKGKATISSRSSPGIISDFMLGLGLGAGQEDQRLKLICQMGFGGLINLNLYKLNKPLGAWLLSKLDPVSGKIISSPRSSIGLTCQNTGLVLGIPFKGKEINSSTPKEVATMKKYLCSVFGKNQFSEITINFLWRILEKKPEDIMSHDEIRQFKMAFVICIITKFLAPVSLNNFISPRYMKALIDVDNISQYNWAKFVVDELKLAAVSLQEKLANGKAAGYINGCIILLQILYLDNLDFGTDSLPHDRFPRISAYNDSNVADLMKRDILLPNRWPFPSFGKHKLRDPRQSCYAQQTCSPATDARNINQESPHTPSVQQVSAHTPRDIEVSTDTHIDLVSAHTSSALQVSIDTRSMIQVSADTQSPIRDSGHAKSMPGISPPSFSLGLTQMLDDSPEPHIKTNLNRDFEMVADQQAVVPETPPEKQGCSKTVAEENLWNAEDHIHLFTDSTLVPYDVSQCRL